MANISRRYIENCGEVFREDILEHAQTRAMVLREMLENLKSKYTELDSVLGKRKTIHVLEIRSSAIQLFQLNWPFIQFECIALITEHRFTNPQEMKLDAELDICRQIRDKLGGAVEQWRYVPLHTHSVLYILLCENIKITK